MKNSSRLGELGQFVTGAVDRQNVLRALRIDLDLGAQIRDVPIERPVEHLAAVARDELDQTIAREHLTGMIRKDTQQAVFRRGQLDRRPVAIDFVRR